MGGVVGAGAAGGSRMEIPRPKRERYKVICAHPECGHEDQIGF